MMRKYFLIGGAIVLGVVLGFYIQPVFSGDNIYQQMKKVEFVLNTAVKNYVDEVDTQKLVESAIKGMLGELDVHSVFISAEDMKKVNEDFQGSFEGIGVEFDILNDTLTVVSPIPGGPSEMLGVMSGDKIIKIDGDNVVGIDRSEVPKKLKGPKGTIVKIDVKRGHQTDLVHFAITRDKIPLNTVDASFMIDGTDVGVVIINRFAATTHQEMMEALGKLKTEGMKKLVLDLRGNPGGYLNQAYQMADEFLNKGDTIVFTKGRKPTFDELYVSSGGVQYSKIPLIVMVNAGSASASEIVSGAIQDLDRGLIVGETSFGKGLVQRQYEIGDGSTFRLTIAKYYTPTGRCIQRPYKDKDKYRHLFGRLELEEGSYIENAIPKIKKQVAELNEKMEKENKEKKTKNEIISIDSLPLYKTKKGRTVFGGGGITPDVIVKSDTITKLGVDLRRKNLFLEFTSSYVNGKGSHIKDKYINNFSSFLRNYQISQDVMNEFKALAESKEIKWDAELFKADKEFIEKSLKAQIARTIWDRNKFLQILYTMDKQLDKAKDLFPEAEKLSKNR